MINDSLIDPPSINAGVSNGNGSQDHGYSPSESLCFNSFHIYYDFTILICIFGILGNAMVIWLLGFRIKRNPFTIYILNLAVADFGVLLAAIMFRIKLCSLSIAFKNIILIDFLYYTFLWMFSTSQMFLTVISVDRCVSVFVPLWHRCHRPTWLSTLLCALSWLLYSITAPTDYIFYVKNNLRPSKVVIYLFIGNGFLCLPLMTISSLMLFFKVCCKSRQRRRQKLLTTILVTVSFFLFCCFPFNTFMLMFYLKERTPLFLFGAMFFACLNSSINPLIYYLVGRRKEGSSNKSMKGILQNLFKEEETDLKRLGVKKACKIQKSLSSN